MKKLKKKSDLLDKETKQHTGEEYFQLPRAEYLVEEIEKGRARQIGDLVTNPSLQVEDRFTLQASDNLMKGADIQAGDYIVVKKQPDYPEGCILAVQMGKKQLIRRYFHAGSRIHLQCDPPSHQITIVEKHTPDFKILGQVFQVIREIK
jgi:SOS-response transcriptional repressor LexA